MYFKLLVVFAMVGMVVAKSSEEERTLYVEVRILEKFIFSETEQLKPETMKDIVTELMENLYKKLPLPKRPSRYDRWSRSITETLYAIANVKKENCAELDKYNKTVDDLVDKYSPWPDAAGMIRFYQQQQNQLCK